MCHGYKLVHDVSDVDALKMGYKPTPCVIVAHFGIPHFNRKTIIACFIMAKRSCNLPRSIMNIIMTITIELIINDYIVNIRRVMPAFTWLCPNTKVSYELVRFSRGDEWYNIKSRQTAADLHTLLSSRETYDYQCAGYDETSTSFIIRDNSVIIPDEGLKSLEPLRCFYHVYPI